MTTRRDSAGSACRRRASAVAWMRKTSRQRWSRSRRVGRHERVRLDRGARNAPRWRADATSAPGPQSTTRNGRAWSRRVGAERRLPHAILRQRLQVDVDLDVRAAEREAWRLGDQPAALGDQAVAVPGQVGGRLAEAGGAVHLHREVARRRAAHQLLPVLPLGDGDVGRRQVGEHRRTGRAPRACWAAPAPRGPRRCRCAARSPAGAAGGTSTSVPNGTSPPSRVDAARRRLRRRAEPAQLVELAVVRRIRLRRHRQRPAAIERHRAVEQQPVDDQRRADREHQVPVGARLGHLRQRRAHALEQRLLEEEIAAGVGAQPELGAERVVGAGAMRGLELLEMGGGVEGRLGDAHRRHADGDPRVAVGAHVEKVAIGAAGLPGHRGGVYIESPQNACASSSQRSRKLVGAIPSSSTHHGIGH